MKFRNGSFDAARLMAFSSVLVFSLMAGNALAADEESSVTTTTTTTEVEPSASMAPDEQLQQAEQMVGQKVVNQQGEELGKVDSIVRDSQSQQLSAVISSGGFLGMGQKKVVAPLDQLQLQPAPQTQEQGPQDQQSAQQGPQDQMEAEQQVVIQADVTKENLDKQLAVYDEQRFQEVQMGESDQTQTAGTEAPAEEAPAGDQG